MGVIHYSAGHLIAYFLRCGDHWEKRDEMPDVIDNVQGNVTSIAAFYIEKKI